MTEGAAPLQAVAAVVVAVLRPKIEPINSTEEAFHCVFRPCDPDSLSVNSRQPQSAQEQQRGEGQAHDPRVVGTWLVGLGEEEPKGRVIDRFFDHRPETERVVMA